ncbi:Ada metal-binding domain-containing protein [Salinithrix halophila]|uniref:Ada metal-binding domain-containing protein n=1 Tax=Salinithrix halophila TaxID=1485204 RepID=A0ABV8JBG8_9BACL
MRVEKRDEMVNAIFACDPSYDGRFWYGVQTTGVFCRPSCRSPHPKRENLHFFNSPDEARKAGFRPCKRCQPEQAEMHP